MIQIDTKYITIKEYADSVNRSVQRVRKWCTSHKVQGAIKVAGVWLLPQNAKPDLKSVGRPAKKPYKAPEGVDRGERGVTDGN